MQAVAGESYQRLASEAGRVGMTLGSHNSILVPEPEPVATPVAATTPFTQVPRPRILETRFPAISEENVCVAGTPAITGSPGGFAQ